MRVFSHVHVKLHSRSLSYFIKSQILTYPIMSFRDEWPKMPDGEEYNGKELLSLVRSGNSPFAGVWDIELLIGEFHENLDTKVIDIPVI